MTIAAKLRRSGRKIAAFALALTTAMGVTVAVNPSAHADNRSWLRPDNTGSCEWDAVQYWVQRCDVWSPSMNRNVAVQIQPARNGGNAGLYLLDGMRATEYTNAVATQTDAPAIYANHNITLVMPIGGAGSFYTDWEGNASFEDGKTVNYKWETFLTRELPGYLQAHFGVSPSNNAIGGLSMGGTAAISLAANHPEQFHAALSYSGYLTMTMPGMYVLLSLAMLDVGLFNINSMYGSIIAPKRFQDDPFWAHERLRANNTAVYISAATGIPGADVAGVPAGQILSGMLLETGSRVSTRLWEGKARLSGMNPVVDYPVQGIHNWPEWNSQIHKSKNFVLDNMNAW